MIVIALDQCVISELAKAKYSSIWFNIRELLTERVQKRQIICPVDSYFICESFAPNLITTQASLELLSSLSRGLQFSQYTDLLVDSILKLVRPQFKVNEMVNFIYKDELHKNFIPRINEKMTHLNDVNKKALNVELEAKIKLEKQSKTSDETFKTVLENIRFSISADLFQQLKRFIAQQPLMDTVGGGLCSMLIERSLTLSEAIVLLDLVRHKVILNLKILDSYIRLSAIENRQIHACGLNYNMNHTIDKERACIALVCAKVFVADRGIISRCKELRGDFLKDNILFLSSKPDQFYNWLLSYIE